MDNMPKITIGVGVILIALGLYAYFGTGTYSVTALIPAFFGLPILIAGVVGLNENYLKHAMHVAVVLTLLGFLGTITGLIGVVTLLSGGEVARPTATVVQAIMSVACLVHVGLSVRSFIQARRNREAAAG